MKEAELIQYPAFRAWQSMHKRSNNSIVALAIGANLAEREMSRSAALAVKAAEVLAGVARAERLDATATDAERIFRTAEADIAFMAIPQIVAIHIELCVGTVVECRRFPGLVKAHGNSSPERWNVPNLAEAVRFGREKTVTEFLMDFSVKLRNTIMHGAGKVDYALAVIWNDLPSAAKGRWSELAGRPFTYARVGALSDLGWGEMKAILAVTKESANKINVHIERVLTREQWAQVIARDYRDGSPRGRRRFNSTTPGKMAMDGTGAAHPKEERALQRLRAHAATYYGPLVMSSDELRVGRETIR